MSTLLMLSDTSHSHIGFPIPKTLSQEFDDWLDLQTSVDEEGISENLSESRNLLLNKL